MAKVSFKIVAAGSEFKLSNDKDELVPAYTEGQIIFAEGLRKIFLDFHDKRTCYTPSGINYLGIVQAAFDPTKEDTWKLNGETETFTPNELDMVVHGTKEYLFRNNGWHEIGDEDAPEWNT